MKISELPAIYSKAEDFISGWKTFLLLSVEQHRGWYKSPPKSIAKISFLILFQGFVNHVKFDTNGHKLIKDL